MVKVCVLQADNRPTLSYLLKTKSVNMKFCKKLNFEYLFKPIDNNKYGKLHPATKKIHIVNEVLQSGKYDIIIFLDSDAWIQNGYIINKIVDTLWKDTKKHGAFSRDPYVARNTYINSGSFMIKTNNYVKQMYAKIINNLQKNTTHHNKWPFDQFYISNYVYENRKDFIVFVPDILNTPLGKGLKHNWQKNKRMYDDLEKLEALTDSQLCAVCDFKLEDHIDNVEFPNKNAIGYEYKEEKPATV